MKDAKLTIIGRGKIEKVVVHKERFRTRRLPTSSKPTPAAIALATACAVDANTQIYIKTYNGDPAVRDDYIDYMADKFQFMMNGGQVNLKRS